MTIFRADYMLQRRNIQMMAIQTSTHIRHKNFKMANFTDTYIKNLRGKEKRYEEYEVGGFGIRITPNHLKS